ncbi:MAG: DUF1501 domain-containing protein [Kofleriaceae bacterium]
MLKLLGGGAAALTFGSPLFAGGSAAPADQFFVLVHAAGGWDVTLWSDPRNERRGLVEPASSLNTDPGRITHWKAARLDGSVSTFEPLAPGNTSLRLGPAIGDLYDLRDRLTIINGIAMNTVSHDDGTTFSVTGRHRAGGIIPASSIDVMLANELGTGQMIPDVAVHYPSSFVGDQLDRRVIPMRINRIEEITKVLERTDQYLLNEDRDDITAVLAAETRRLGETSRYPQTFDQLASQHATLPTLLAADFKQAFGAKQLQAKYPAFDYRSRSHADGALSAAFAVEAFSRNLVRCVSFGLGGLDTHDSGYRQHASTLQDLFGVIATLVKQLDVTPHPTRIGAKLSEHTHLLVVSDFCRTPQVNLAGGRDHYPNNSALVISPRFRGGREFGKTDIDQLLPTNAVMFSGGPRPIAPPDVLATFLGAFKIDPRRYLRDGEVVKEMLV